MNDSKFLVLADATLKKIEEMIEDDFKDFFEIDYQDGVLTILLENEDEYVLNRHLPQHQIWLSSPISGTYYFNYNLDECIWVTSQKEIFYLFVFLKNELKSIMEKSSIK